MLKLMKYLKESAWLIILAVVMLVVQAYCDLALPEYTAKIVDVGITKGGIDDAIPKTIRKSEFERVLVFVKSEDKEMVKSAYELKGDNYELIEDKEDSELDEKVGQAVMFVYMLETVDKDDEDTKETREQILSMMQGMQSMQQMQGGEADQNKTKSVDEKSNKADKKESKKSNKKSNKEAESKANINVDEITSEQIFQMLSAIPEEQMDTVIEQIFEKFEDLPDMAVESTINAYLQEEYEKAGLDVDDIQIKYIIYSGARMLILSFGIMLMSIIVGFLAAKVGAKLSRTLRNKVFTKVVGYSNSEFDKFSTASLITRSTNDIQQVQLVVTLMIRMIIYAPILAVGGVLKVLKTNSSMTWIIGVGVGGILLLILALFIGVMPKFKILQKQLDKLNLIMREIVSGLPVIRAFSTERYEENRFDGANKEYTKTNLFVGRAMSCMMPIMTLIMNGLSVLIIWVSAHKMDDGTMQVGEMTAFITYTMQIVISFLMLSMLTIMLPRAIVAAGRIDEVLTTDLSIKDKDEVKTLTNKKGEICFENVDFAYEGADEVALSNISFTAKPGQTTAIIGSTGCGKSTLVNLIPRFYDVTKGKITIDGVDVRELSQHELREQIGYVPQKAVLFSGTIESNIKFADETMSNEDMEKAASIAQATEFIENKDEKYASYISQGGTNVSGGQKQRLSIARAIAKHPNVYIFDDSFSALDYKTDVTLRKELKKNTADSTVIIVAQRISTILQAEQIIVLDDGNIAGIGTHEELLKNCEVYQQIALSQLSEEELKKGGVK